MGQVPEYREVEPGQQRLNLLRAESAIAQIIITTPLEVQPNGNAKVLVGDSHHIYSRKRRYRR
jgi:hypothetical protein